MVYHHGIMLPPFLSSNMFVTHFFVCLCFVFWPQESKTSMNRELFCLIHYYIPQVSQQVKNLPVSAGDAGGADLIPGSGISP